MRLASADDLLNWEIARKFSRSELTRYPQKADYYCLEPRFREGLYAVARHTGELDFEGLGQRIRNVGLAMLRPDAFRFGTAIRAIGYLDRLGLSPTRWQTVHVDELRVRELWRYQLNAASLARLRLLDALFAQSASIVLLFEAGASAPPVPCSVILADAKGEADPASRAGWELRSYLESPNKLLSYIHAADEPADAVRDGSLLLGPETLGREMVSPPQDRALLMREIRRLEVGLNGQGGQERSTGTGPEFLDYRDVWHALQNGPTELPMTSGDPENLIDHPGTDGWWAEVGLLECRDAVLQRLLATDGDALEGIPNNDDAASGRLGPERAGDDRG